jgi:hypothetical protein
MFAEAADDTGVMGQRWHCCGVARGTTLFRNSSGGNYDPKGFQEKGEKLTCNYYH